MPRSVPLLLLLAFVAQPACAQLRRPPSPRSPLEVTIDAHNARVLSAREGVVPPQRTVMLAGLVASYRAAGGRFEYALRVRRSTLAEDLAFGDAALTRHFGAFGADAGVGWRRGYDAASGALHGTTHTFLRVGGAWREGLTATPLTLEARLAAYLPLGAGQLPGGALSGWEGESTVRVALGASDFDALVGFRIESFEVDRLAQEVTLLRGGVVWRWGGR